MGANLTLSCPATSPAPAAAPCSRAKPDEPAACAIRSLPLTTPSDEEAMKKHAVALTLSCPAPTDRERIWAAIRELREFTQLEVAVKSNVDRRNGKIRDYLVGLVRAGIVERLTHTRYDSRYRLARDMGVNAPRVRKTGVMLPPSGRNRMWRAMRILKTFTARELAQAASLEQAPVAVSEAESYCAWLARGGYLRGVGKRWNFVPGRDTGPKAPQILRVRQLYDPNTDKIVYRCHAEGRDDE